MIAACNSFYSDQDEGPEEAPQQQGESVASTYTGPRTLDGRPAPQSASSRPARAAAQPKKKGIATLGSLAGGSHHHDDDDDDDEDDDEANDGDDDGRGNLFAGGEKSGLAVQDPDQAGGSKKIIHDILAKARAYVWHGSINYSLTINRSSSRPGADEPGAPTQDRFRGTGNSLGGDGVESRSVPDPLGPSRSSNATPQERVLHIWQDGFSIDDGELRRFDDPANQMDLQMIRSGRAPLHLMNVQHDQPVDVKLHQHDTPYVAQPQTYKPFSGSGQRLGSPLPGAPSAASAPAQTSTPAASLDTAPTVDSSQPTLMLRIQMPDGTRLPARFNTSQTLADVYAFVQSASADTRTRSWTLATTFPNKDHNDQSLVLGEMPEFKKGGTAMVKWT